MQPTSVRFQGIFVVQTPENPVKKLVQSEAKQTLKKVDFRIFQSATQPDQWVIATKKKTEDKVHEAFQKVGFQSVTKAPAGGEDQVYNTHFPVDAGRADREENQYKRKHLRELHKLSWLYGPSNRRKPNEVIELQDCTVRVDRNNDYLVTEFKDGTRVEAVPGKKLSYYETAENLGYGVDIGALSREHELFHTLVSEVEGQPYSPTLWAVAHKFGPGTAPKKEQFLEEDRVMKFQQYVNGMEEVGQQLAEAVRDLKDKAIKLIRK